MYTTQSDTLIYQLLLFVLQRVFRALNSMGILWCALIRDAILAFRAMKEPRVGTRAFNRAIY